MTRDPNAWLRRAVLLGAAVVAACPPAQAQPALAIQKEVVVETGGAVAKAMTASSDGGVIVVGERGGKPETGREIWIAKLDSALNTVWRAAIPAGAPLPSSLDAHAAFIAPDGSVHVLGMLDACDVNASTGKCKAGVERRRGPVMIKLDAAGKLAWMRPLECMDLECRVDRLVGVAPVSDGLILMRAVTLPAAGGSSRPQSGRLVQKITWDGKPAWQKLGPPPRGITSRIEAVDSRFVFVEIASDGVWGRSMDAAGNLAPAVATNVKCLNGSFQKTRTALALFCPTDTHPEKDAIVGGRLVRLAADFRVLSEVAIKEMSTIDLIAPADRDLVLIGSTRSEIGARASAAAAVVADGGKVSRLRLERGFNTGPTRAAAKALDRDEYFVAYDASSGPFRTAENGIVVVSRLRLER